VNIITLIVPTTALFCPTFERKKTCPNEQIAETYKTPTDICSNKEMTIHALFPVALSWICGQLLMHYRMRREIDKEIRALSESTDEAICRGNF